MIHRGSAPNPRSQFVLSKNQNGTIQHTLRHTAGSSLHQMSSSLSIPSIKEERRKSSKIERHHHQYSPQNGGRLVEVAEPYHSSPPYIHNGRLNDFQDEEDVSEAAASGSKMSSSSPSNFEEFCNCTSLHGWKYLASNVNYPLRIGWVTVVLASMGVASFFLGYSSNDFLSSTVQTTQDTSR